MQFVGRSGVPSSPLQGSSTARFTELSFYKDSPDGNISLEEFERFALDRLRILKAIEDNKLRSRSEEATQDDVTRLLKEHMKEGSQQETLHKDCVSHYILRLAYCRTADLRNWLLQYETDMFRVRFRNLDRAQQVEFFKSVGLPYTPIDHTEYAQVQKLLADVAISTGDVASRAKITAGEAVFYKVPWMVVPDLVAQRRVLLQMGSAYVAQDQLYSLVTGAFRAHLSAALVDMSRKWSVFTVQEGFRLAPLVESMPSRSLVRHDPRKLPQGQISMGQIPELVASRAFPLCMTTMYQRLTSEHHLKHYGRMQFSLFLKAIGLPLEQALMFFKQHFSPRTSGDKFDKEYAYNVRHHYGKEGKHMDYNEMGCVKIISSDAPCSSGEACNGGCPFKQLGEADLRAALARMRCSDRHINEAVDKAKGRHYQIACAISFEGMHGVPCDTGINKPSEFYALARVAAQAAQRQAGAQQGTTAQQQAAAAAQQQGGSGGITQQEALAA